MVAQTVGRDLLLGRSLSCKKLFKVNMQPCMSVRYMISA
jgi:hypothetical protein